MSSRLIKRLKTDGHYRIKVFLRFSVLFNFLYSVFLFVVNRINGSDWLFIMSVYYALLSVVRIFIFLQIEPRKQLRTKLKTMRWCGYFLFLLNVVVSALIFILIYKNQTVKHHEITVIALATYTFSSLTIAIVSSVKYLKKRDYVYSCVKVISLVCASVSIVTLTNIMLATFGEENMLLRSIILPILSAVVCSFIIVCAILMIRTANIELRKLKNEEERE